MNGVLGASGERCRKMDVLVSFGGVEVIEPGSAEVVVQSTGEIDHHVGAFIVFETRMLVRKSVLVGADGMQLEIQR